MFLRPNVSRGFLLIYVLLFFAGQSTLIVTPTRVLPRFDDQPTIGIEGLFQDFQRPEIQPTSVKRYQFSKKNNRTHPQN